MNSWCCDDRSPFCDQDFNTPQVIAQHADPSTPNPRLVVAVQAFCEVPFISSVATSDDMSLSTGPEAPNWRNYLTASCVAGGYEVPSVVAESLSSAAQDQGYSPGYTVILYKARMCPQQHILLPFVTCGEGSCGQCGMGTDQGGNVLDCRDCNWHLCHSCSYKSPSKHGKTHAKGPSGGATNRLGATEGESKQDALQAKWERMASIDRVRGGMSAKATRDLIQQRRRATTGSARCLCITLLLVPPPGSIRSFPRRCLQAGIAGRTARGVVRQRMGCIAREQHSSARCIQAGIMGRSSRVNVRQRRLYEEEARSQVGERLSLEESGARCIQACIKGRVLRGKMPALLWHHTQDTIRHQKREKKREVTLQYQYLVKQSMDVKRIQALMKARAIRRGTAKRLEDADHASATPNAGSFSFSYLAW